MFYPAYEIRSVTFPRGEGLFCRTHALTLYILRDNYNNITILVSVSPIQARATALIRPRPETTTMGITDYRIEKLRLPCTPGISDSHRTFESTGVTYLELETEHGLRGVGLGGADPDQPAKEFRRQFESVADHLLGESPFHLRNRLRLPGGGPVAF